MAKTKLTLGKTVYEYPSFKSMPFKHKALLVLILGAGALIWPVALILGLIWAQFVGFDERNPFIKVS